MSVSCRTRETLTAWSSSLPAALSGPNGNGILGIGPNVGSYAVSGPGNVVTTDLPGQLNEGTLIDIPGGYMQFGPNTGTQSPP